MTRIRTVFISGCFLLGSCSNPPEAENHAGQNDSANFKANIGRLKDILKKQEVPSQNFKIPAGKPGIVKGRKGTQISVNPNDLETQSGKPLGQNIELELKELTNQGELLRTNAQTVSDGQLLVSGGAYFIGMTSGGERLKLKEGKKLSVRFPKLSDKGMTLFYGQRNEAGQMNWQKASETFKITQQGSPASDSTIRRSKGKSELDAIFDYIEKGDTTTTPEERERAAKRQRERTEKWEQENKTRQKLYDEIGIDKLGWINCDRFLEVKDKTDLYVDFNPKDSIKSADVYLVFKDINSMMYVGYYNGDKPKFEDLPVGYKTRLLAYTVKNEKVFAYSSDLTIAKGQKMILNFKEISEEDFKKLLSN